MWKLEEIIYARLCVYIYMYVYTYNFIFQMTVGYKLVVFLYQLSLFCVVLDCPQ